MLALPISSTTDVSAALHVHTPYLSFRTVLDSTDVPVTVGGEGMPGAASATRDIPTVPFAATGVLGLAKSGG